MSIVTDLERIKEAKTAITSAIAIKGIFVPESTKLDEYATYIGQIQSGGGASTGVSVLDRYTMPGSILVDCSNAVTAYILP